MDNLLLLFLPRARAWATLALGDHGDEQPPLCPMDKGAAAGLFKPENGREES
jgi:hypothetical protein